MNDQSINIKILDSLGKLVFQSSNQKVILNNEIPYDPTIDRETSLGDPESYHFNKVSFIFIPFLYFNGHLSAENIILSTEIDFYESSSKVKKKEVTKKKT